MLKGTQVRSDLRVHKVLKGDRVHKDRKELKGVKVLKGR